MAELVQGMADISIDQDVRDDYNSTYSADADEPGDLEDFNSIVAFFGKKSRVTAILNEYLERNNPIIRRWVGRTRRNATKGNLGPEEWQRYQTWLGHRSNDDRHGMLDAVKSQMAAEHAQELA